ncbi:hypothetical protein [Legionella cardiaca]|uniref:Uncharacterized protein n=1 Tax=Legionella cardiaca TaxID=1071983 RepID=A0ABY8AWB6_9GAMM|nr:hypothetical protein [Legionella cardiaca]WED44034.1 hypothetical protein PXX05_04405 [Legionella cardiaca]
MRYEIAEIQRFSREVEMACGRTGVPAIFPQSTWKENKNFVESALKELVNTESSESILMRFEKYAQAVNTAAKWLAQSPKSKEKEIDQKVPFFTEHMRHLQQGAKQLLPDAEMTLPTVIYEESDQNSPAVTAFFTSEVFRKLDSYKNYLKNDRRSHFFGRLDMHGAKYAILDALINDLKAQKSMEGVRKVFQDFYKQYDSTGKQTRYDVINTGQDILTYILGLFGLKKTTSADFLNNLNQYAEDTNEFSLGSSNPVESFFTKLFN